MKSKSTRSRRLSRMPNNRSLRDLLLREKYCPKAKKVNRPENKRMKLRKLNEFEKAVIDNMRKRKKLSHERLGL